MNVTRSLVLLAVLGAACTTAPPIEVAAATAVAADTGPLLEVGQVHHYTLDWHADATRTQDRAGVSGGLTLQGELAVAAISHGPEGTRVSVWFPRLSTRELRVQGRPVELDEAALVGPRAEFLVAADGDVRRAFFGADSPPIFRELMTGVIARLDLRGASTNTGPRTIRGGHGLVEATYHRDAHGVVTRELAGVLRFDTAPGANVDPKALSSTGLIELDDARVPVRIELHDGATLTEELGLVAD